MKKSLITALSLSGLMLFSSSVAAQESLDIDHAWIALQPPGAQASAAFMYLQNPTEEDVAIVSAAAPGFNTIELHLSVNEDGMHRMIEQDEIVVEAGDSLVMAPGGYHVMLIGPEQDLTEGQMVPVALTLASGAVIEQDIEVIRREHAPEPTSGKPMPGGHHHGGGHHH